jgi:hypothetical protein
MGQLHEGMMPVVDDFPLDLGLLDMTEQFQDSDPRLSLRFLNGLILAREFFDTRHVLPEATNDRSIGNVVADQCLVWHPHHSIISLINERPHL